jgi:AcrR family transcriptional regulator
MSLTRESTSEFLADRKGVGRPRDGDPDETRRDILGAAERAFAAAGFSGATTRQIAGAARVNVATLHYHFGGKKGLYRAVLAEVAQGDLPVLAEEGIPADRLRRLIGAVFDFTAKRASLPRLSLLNDLAGPAADDTEPPAEDRRVAFTGSALRSCRTDGGGGRTLAGQRPEEVARLIVRLIDVALVDPPGRDGTGAARDLGAVRETVVEAALRIAGVSGGPGPAPSR